MPFSGLTDQEIAPDKPVSTTLLKKIKDNFDDHEARIGGGGGAAGAIGEVLNGSFEVDSDSDGVPDNWTRQLYPAGTSAIDSSDYCHGLKSFRFTHPGGAGNGGGHLETGFISVSQLYSNPVPFAYKCSAAGIKVQVIARFFNAAQTYLGEQTLFSNVNNPLRWYLVDLKNIPFAYPTARWIKYRFVGGATDVNVAGSVWFDAVGFPQGPTRTRLSDSITFAPYSISYNNSWIATGAIHTLTIPASVLFKWLALKYQARAGWSQTSDETGSVNYYSTLNSRVRVFQASGTPFSLYSTVSTITSNGGSDLTEQTAFVDISSLTAGVYRLQFEYQNPSPGGLTLMLYSQLGASNPNAHYFGVGKLEVDAFSGVITEVYT